MMLRSHAVVFKKKTQGQESDMAKPGPCFSVSIRQAQILNLPIINKHADL